MTEARGRWRFREPGIERLHVTPGCRVALELRPRRPHTTQADEVAELINRALQRPPTEGTTQWSARSLAAATGISKPTVHRRRQTCSLQPHRQKAFKLSTAPFFVEKVRAIVGLYLNPADTVVVLGVDEKTQIQLPGRIQQLLPLGFGHLCRARDP